MWQASQARFLEWNDLICDMHFQACGTPPPPGGPPRAYPTAQNIAPPGGGGRLDPPPPGQVLTTQFSNLTFPDKELGRTGHIPRLVVETWLAAKFQKKIPLFSHRCRSSKPDSIKSHLDCPSHISMNWTRTSFYWGLVPCQSGFVPKPVITGPYGVPLLSLSLRVAKDSCAAATYHHV